VPFLAALKRVPRSRWVWLTVAVVAAVAIAGGSYFGYAELKDRRRVEQLAEVYRGLALHLQGSDIGPVADDLRTILILSPDNAEAARRLADLTAGHATAGDTEVAALLLREHLRHGNVDRAATEAEAVVALVPAHWEARAVLAERALRRGDRESAARQLKTLQPPNPTVPVYALLAVTRLAEKVGDADRLAEMRDFLASHALPALRSHGAVLEPVGARLCLLECWHAVWPKLPVRPQLAGYWDAAQRICQSIQNEPGVAADSLIALGMLQEAHLEMLSDIRRHKLIAPADADTARREVEAALAAIWESVLRKDDKSAAAYIGLAMHRCRGGDLPGAAGILARGRQACGDRPELLLKTAEVTSATDPGRAVDFLDATTTPAAATEDLLRVWAEAAGRAGRAERILAVCGEATRRAPANPWARRWEAEALLHLGRPADAVTVLDFLRPRTTDDPAVAQLYALALTRAAAPERAEQFVTDLLDRSGAADVAVAAVRGVLLAGQSAVAARHGRRVLDRHPDHFNAAAIYADCLRELAAQGGKSWDRNAAQQAVDAYRRAGRLRPDDLAVANQIVRLELKALGRPRDALRSAEPLAAAEASLPPEYLETLAMVRLETGQFAEARVMLERAVAARPNRAGLHLNLVRAYYGLGLMQEAKQALARAKELARTPTELAELEEVRRLLGQPE
jgi:tetratricopeptide (TPR) repeat protein